MQTLHFPGVSSSCSYIIQNTRKPQNLTAMLYFIIYMHPHLSFLGVGDSHTMNTPISSLTVLFWRCFSFQCTLKFSLITSLRVYHWKKKNMTIDALGHFYFLSSMNCNSSYSIFPLSAMKLTSKFCALLQEIFLHYVSGSTNSLFRFHGSWPVVLIVTVFGFGFLFVCSFNATSNLFGGKKKSRA